MIRKAHVITWLVLALALLGFNLFAVQASFVAQPRDHYANWHGARWIAAPQGSNGITYFRKKIYLQNPVDNAFLTVQASQYYQIYVNGKLIDTTQADFESGLVNSAYIYDVGALLQEGANSIALRVVNQDTTTAAVRVVLGIGLSSQLITFPSDTSWHATADPTLVKPLHLPTSQDWRKTVFDDSTWSHATYMSGALPRDGVLPVDPVVYETPLATRWIVGGSDAESFFYRPINLASYDEAWLRVVGNGEVQVFLNGHRLIEQPALFTHDPNGNPIPAAADFTIGVYDVSPYLHAGTNDLAVHVASLGFVSASGDVQPKPGAMALDLITIANGQPSRISVDSSWRASSTPTTGWQYGHGIGSWPLVTQVDGSTFTSTTPYKVIATSLEIIDPWSVIPFVSLVTLLVIAAFGASIALSMWQLHTPIAHAFDKAAFAFIPALAMMGLLLAISAEPLVMHPFPFTFFWLSILAGLVIVSMAAIFVMDLLRPAIADAPIIVTDDKPTLQDQPIIHEEPSTPRTWRTLIHDWSQPSLILHALPVIGLLAIAFAMVTYNLRYESYWADEVTSIYAAQGILHTGVPRLLSNFIYPKAELYHYCLAFVMFVFGTDQAATRSLSVVMYLASLVGTYIIGRKLFQERIALIALALMVFSPLALRWGREARMYQMAELMVLIVVYLFYRATWPKAKPAAIYLSMAGLVVMYLSHEETFIVLPALAIYFLVTQRLTWIRNPHWWIGGLGAITIIMIQLFAVQFTHPPILGTDHSQASLISFGLDNVDFYFNLLFNSRSLSRGTLAAMEVTSVLALIAAIRAIFLRNRALRYLSTLFWVSVLGLALLFTLTADRYIYPLLPVMSFLAASTIVWLIDQLTAFARQRLNLITARAVVVVFSILLLSTVLLAQTTAIANFSLATSRALNLPYHHHYPNYQQAGNYIRAHWQDGDILISLSPAIDSAYYAKRPTFFIYQDKALYLFEHNGDIIDTPSGSTALLSEQDLATVLAKYHRIWLFAADGYACCNSSVNTLNIPNYFGLVFEGQGTYIYLRSG